MLSITQYLDEGIIDHIKRNKKKYMAAAALAAGAGSLVPKGMSYYHGKKAVEDGGKILPALKWAKWDIYGNRIKKSFQRNIGNDASYEDMMNKVEKNPEPFETAFQQSMNDARKRSLRKARFKMQGDPGTETLPVAKIEREQ